MGNALVLLDSPTWGRGKTATCAALATHFASKNLRVGGILSRRVYAAEGGRDTLVGYEAYLPATDSAALLAHARRRIGTKEVQLGLHRKQVLEGGGRYFIDTKAVQSALQHFGREAESGEMDVMILDEVGPILDEDGLSHRRLIEESVETILDHPALINIITFTYKASQSPTVLTCRRMIETRNDAWVQGRLCYNLEEGQHRPLDRIILHDLENQEARKPPPAAHRGTPP